MSAKSKHLAAYKDVKKVLDSVMQIGTAGTYKCDTEAAAMVWISRANRMRTIMRRNDEIRHNLVQGEGASLYDELILRRNGPTVLIEFRKQPGKLEIDGQEIDLDASTLKGDFF